jgi:alpha-glucosidase
MSKYRKLFNKSIMIIYQIYPRSFYDTNQDGIGDLNGITEKLEYIKSLNVDAIWISPFFKSPMKDFGYDVSNYREVDPLFGNIDDFKNLIKKAKSLNLGIIVDMVISHTSNQHLWFEDSVNKTNGKDDWYLWSNANADGTPPNNWLSVFGGSAWQWDSTRKQYYFHTFLTEQPDLNMHNPEVQNQVLEEMKYWLDLGITGFRLDACNHYFQDLELRNNPAKRPNGTEFKPYSLQEHVYDQGRPEILPFLEKIRSLLDKYNAYSVAEVGGEKALQFMGQYTDTNRLHSAYSFSLMQPNFSASYIQAVIESLEGSIKEPSQPCYALSNHDKPRVATRWSDGRNQEKTIYQSMALLMSLRGNLCVYQGDELGYPEAEVAFEDIQDPYGKTYWPKFKGRDSCRTPMSWDNTLNAGFSTVKPWLPVPVIHQALNVEKQNKDKNSFLNTFRKFMNYRQKNDIFKNGTIEFFKLDNEILSFKRTYKNKTLLCLFSMSLEEKIVDLNNIKIKETIFNQEINVNENNTINFKPCSFLIALI